VWAIAHAPTRKWPAGRYNVFYDRPCPWAASVTWPASELLSWICASTEAPTEPDTEFNPTELAEAPTEGDATEAPTEHDVCQGNTDADGEARQANVLSTVYEEDTTAAVDTTKLAYLVKIKSKRIKSKTKKGWELRFQ